MDTHDQWNVLRSTSRSAALTGDSHDGSKRFFLGVLNNKAHSVKSIYLRTKGTSALR